MVDLVKKLWRGSGKADKLTLGQFDQGTILAGNGNDQITIDAVQGGLIDLGANNDILSIVSFFSMGANQLVTTIDGGKGSDRLEFSALSTSDLKWLFKKGQGWSVSDVNEFALVKNVETVVFQDKVNMTLTMDGKAKITGTAEADTIQATTDEMTRVTVSAGAGDDFITLNGSVSRFSSSLSLIDGGDGQDTLEQQGDQKGYRLTQSRSGWHLQTRGDDARWRFAGRLVNIEKVAFGDGSTIELTQTGVINTAGKTAAVLNGTSGDDSFKGSVGNDTFNGFGGNDVFDLRAGGADSIDLADVYSAGLTEVKVIGRKVDDVLYAPNGSEIEIDTRAYNKAGIQVGELVLRWDNAVVSITFSTS